MEGKRILNIKNLKTEFVKGKKSLKAIRGIDINVSFGEVLGIVGESGSGKSVAMKSVMKILPENARITSDEAIFDETDLNKLSAKDFMKIRGGGMAMIFQDPMTALNPLKTVGYHLKEVIVRHQGVSKAQANLIAIEHLEKVGIPSPVERLKQYPHEFSGGMRQRVLIAMALACGPKLLIADEPTTALDVTIQAQILELLKELQKEEQMAIILITHDLGVVAGMCDRIDVMYGGLIMEEGLTDEIFYEPKHPYTKALLSSIPSPRTDKNERLQAIPGNAPAISSDPQGCPFEPRCKYSKDICKTEVPEERFFKTGHKARCFALSDDGILGGA